MRKLFGAAVAAAAMVAVPAQAACWSAQDVSAARVRDLQSMLMVAALRCQVSGFDISADYNGFVADNRRAIVAMNETLKRHFSKASGVIQGQRDYDQFTTRLANAYGAHGSNAADCGTASLIARDARLMAGNIDGLLLIAERAGIYTQVPGGMCAPVQMASAAGPQE